MTRATAPQGESAGDRIDRYELLQEIGEGGMGIVYMAEQTEPVERRVALKIIKPGMDSEQVCTTWTRLFSPRLLPLEICTFLLCLGCSKPIIL